MGTGKVFWVTGLSGAGKTTFATELVNRFRSRGDCVIMLDGDELREVFGSAQAGTVNHGREKRLALAEQYAHLCRIIASQGITVVIATISLFREIHEWNREHLPNYFEIYLKVPIEELRRRDPKGIYRRFDEGQITDVAGLDLEIDEPEAPDWVVEYSPNTRPETLITDLMNILQERKFV